MTFILLFYVSFWQYFFSIYVTYDRATNTVLFILLYDIKNVFSKICGYTKLIKYPKFRVTDCNQFSPPKIEPNGR